MTATSSVYSVGDYRSGEGSVIWRRVADPATTSFRGCHMHHGYNALAINYLDTYATEAHQVTARAGVTLTGDDGGPACFGNDTCSGSGGAVDLGAAWLLSQPGVKTDKLIGYAGSMGNLDLFNWIANVSGALAKVACVVSVLPAVDLQDLHDNRYLVTPGDAATFIETAYGGSAGYLAALPTHNPAANPSAFSSIPILLCYSTNDPIAVPSVVTAFAAAVGSNATLYPYAAAGHSIGGLDWDVVGNFIAPHL
jgi:hypothetical protein